MLARLRQLVLSEPWPFVLDLEHCRGMWLATVDGQRLFDWAGYYASKLIGHNHPRLLEPDYVKRLVRAANNKVANPDFLTLECLEYYELLHDLAPRCMRNEQLEVYALNSGAEAVENMLKYFIVLKNQKLLRAGRQSGTHRLIYFDQAFHGRTIYTLSVTELSHDPVATKDFQGFAPGNVQVAFPAVDTSRPAAENRARTERSLEVVEETLARYGREVVGIIVEPIQGAGGHRVAEPEFFQRLSALAHRYDVSLGFDEVQTAGGPTGNFFAVDGFDLPHPPTAIATAKKFGNGPFTCSNRWRTSACWIPPGAARWRTWCASARRCASSGKRVCSNRSRPNPRVSSPGWKAWSPRIPTWFSTSAVWASTRVSASGGRRTSPRFNATRCNARTCCSSAPAPTPSACGRTWK